MSNYSVSANSPEEAAKELAGKKIAAGFILEAIYEFADIQGNIIFWRIRLKHPDGKKYIPSMRLTDGKYTLGDPLDFKGKKKPLYCLHKLVKLNNPVVYITEGENKADCLNRLFKQWGVANQYITVTSGSATSAGGVDWTPLTGRTVIIWRDFDDTGQYYAQAAADILKTLGCDISFIDVAALSLPESSDVIDWIAAHPDATANDILQLSCIKALPETDVWGEPGIIETELRPVTTFDADVLLPEMLRSWVMDTASRMPCPPDFIAAAAIVSIGSIIGARCVIKPKRYDDWAVVPNLWGAIVGLPSSKKSPAIDAALKPIGNLIAAAISKHKEEKTIFDKEKKLCDAKNDALEKELKRAAGRELTECDNGAENEQ